MAGMVPCRGGKHVVLFWTADHRVAFWPLVAPGFSKNFSIILEAFRTNKRKN
jgi:hypothetical protein